MSHRNVERLLGRLATDAAVRRDFIRHPVRALEALAAEGYELTSLEIEALAGTDAAALGAFAAALDRRLRKADLETTFSPFQE